MNEKKLLSNFENWVKFFFKIMFKGIINVCYACQRYIFGQYVKI